VKRKKSSKKRHTVKKNQGSTHLKNTPTDEAADADVKSRQYDSWDDYYEDKLDSYDEYIKAPHIRKFLNNILSRWSGGNILEVGTGTGYMSIWLSKACPYSKIIAVDKNEQILKRAASINGTLNGKALFSRCDAFKLEHTFKDEKFDVVFHQGLLEHFNDDDIVQLLSQQLNTARYVIFSVPSKFYPRQDFGDERLMDIEEWLKILAPFRSAITYSEYDSHIEGEDGKEELTFIIEGRAKQAVYAPEEREKKDESPAAVSVVSAREPEIFWRSVVFNPSGYASLARNFLLGMDRYGIRVSLDPATTTYEGDFDADTWERLIKMVQRKPNKSAPFVHFHPPCGFKGEDYFEDARKFYAGHSRYIGQTIFETDGIPHDWVVSLNKMDEVWVVNEFNFDTFSRAGVIPDKIRIMPLGMNPKGFDPAGTEKIMLPGGKSYNFVSMFEWTKRKGWDILLEAYMKEFDYREDVNLVLFVYRGTGTNIEDKETATEKAARFTMEKLNLDPVYTPKVTIVEKVFPNNYIPKIFNAADCFVLPSRGEGWGIPYMEAMTMGVPTIGTGWGGNTAFMNNDNSYLIDVPGLEPVDDEQIADNPYYKGQKWAVPDVESTRRHMRSVFENRKEAKEKGRFAREDILRNWTIDNVGRAIRDRLIEIDEEDNKKQRGRRIIRPEGAIPQVSWYTEVSKAGGRQEEARNILTVLDKNTSLNLRIGELQSGGIDIKPDEHRLDILRRLSIRPQESGGIHLWHTTPQHFRKTDDSHANIGTISFGADSLPAEWARMCSDMDEIWVSSEFNIRSFEQAGVPPEKLVKIPAAIDTDFYDRAIAPLFIAGRAGFNFLSVFDWRLSKGWDVLIRAFVEEFSNTEDVALVLKCFSRKGLTTADMQNEIVRFITDTLGRSPDDAPSIFLIDRILSEKEMVQLYRAASAYVLPGRCEDTGRTYMEAMAMGLPVIGTNWGPPTEFMTEDNAWLLDCTIEKVSEAGWKDRPELKGMKWAEPSADHLKSLMRRAFENDRERLDKGSQARLYIEKHHNLRTAAELIVNRINTIAEHDPGYYVAGEQTESSQAAVELREKIEDVQKSEHPEPVRITWQGSQLVPHSLALINREVCSRLMNDSRFELSLIPYEPDQPELFSDDDRMKHIPGLYNRKLSGTADIHVAHRWPPDFNPPADGLWILMQPWEFGHLPVDWIRPLSTQIDEVWTYSNAVKRCYIDSGIDADRIKIMPLGVNPDIFHPKAPPYPLKTGKSVKFLFVGGTIWRKGIDMLLDVYVQTFSRNDDVCLVIKDMGGDSFYKGMNAADRIGEIRNNPDSPEIEYITDSITEREIAGLYTACDCLVHPYRGEGFGLPVAEAMASGLPVIVTEGGSTDDFCPADLVYRIPSQKNLVNIEMPLVKQGWALQPDAPELQKMMQSVYDNPVDVKKRDAAAVEYIRSNYTWDHTAQRMAERLEELQKENPVPLRHRSDVKSKEISAPDAPVDADHGTDKIAGDTPEDIITELLAKGDTYFAQKHYKQALHYFSDAWERDRTNVDAAIKCAEAAHRMEDFEQAQRYLEETVRAVPNSPDAYNTLGVFLVNREKLDDAMEQFRKAYSIDPDNNDTLNNLVEVSFMLQKYDETLSYVQKALKKDTGDSSLLLIAANSLAFLGKLEEARDIYRNILDKEPGNKDAADNLKIVEESIQKSQGGNDKQTTD